MALRIPEEDIPAISTLKVLSPTSIEELITALNSTTLNTDLGVMAKDVATRVPSIPVGRLRHILDTLYTLYYIRELAGVKPETFTEDLIQSIQEKPRLAVPKKELGRLRSRLDQLLNIEAFNTLAKAGRLQRDGERLYCDSKILSDIRPVFGSKPTARPIGAVVTHTLKMGYHKGSDHREFHVILDSEDLMALRDIVMRALAKDKALRDLLADAKLPNLGA